MQIDQVFEELLMKMEVLSVQNQYQGQFGVIGSSKNKDWTSPLTPPTSRNSQLHYQQQLRAVNADLSNIADASDNEHFHDNSDDVATDVDVDVVDGLLPRNQQHFYHQNQHAGHQINQYQQYQYQQEQQQNAAMKIETVAAVAAYNNNLVYCDPSPADEVTSPLIDELHFGVPATVEDDVTVEIDEAMVDELSQLLQAELRAAKSRHLACTEVNLPWDLTSRIAVEIIKMSEREPCGVRGCSIFIEFEDEPNNTRRIASFKVDPDMVSTFELYLTLKHDRSGWTSLIPQFLKNLTRSNTILISPDFTLIKNKLYSCE